MCASPSCSHRYVKYPSYAQAHMLYSSPLSASPAATHACLGFSLDMVASSCMALLSELDNGDTFKFVHTCPLSGQLTVGYCIYSHKRYLYTFFISTFVLLERVGTLVLSAAAFLVLFKTAQPDPFLLSFFTINPAEGFPEDNFGRTHSDPSHQLCVIYS